MARIFADGSDFSAWHHAETIRFVDIFANTTFRMAPRLRCVDGYSVSIQTSQYFRCLPRQDTGPWTHFELGMPTHLHPLLDEYAEDQDTTETVFSYVPAATVAAVVNDHLGAIGWSECTEEEAQKLIVGAVMVSGTSVHVGIDGVRLSVESAARRLRDEGIDEKFACRSLQTIADEVRSSGLTVSGFIIVVVDGSANIIRCGDAEEVKRAIKAAIFWGAKVKPGVPASLASSIERSVAALNRHTGG